MFTKDGPAEEERRTDSTGSVIIETQEDGGKTFADVLRTVKERLKDAPEVEGIKAARETKKGQILLVTKGAALATKIGQRLAEGQKEYKIQVRNNTRGRVDH